MLVYGDRQRELPASAAVEEVLQAVRAVASAAPPWGRVGAARDALIAAGRLEQAVHDLDGARGGALAAVQAGTDAAARAFAAVWARTQDAADDREGALARLADTSVDPQLVACARALALAHRELDASGDPLVRATSPEGFTSYALLPEQYAAAALEWSASAPDDDRSPVTVIGVRSIGTTLSAVVAAVLAVCGRSVARTTVRPRGDPYDRAVQLDLPAERADAVARGWSLVVDEGPGRSGSSMAAVVTALRSHGAAPGRIVLLPGHAGGPGSAASRRTLDVWASTAQVVVPAADLRWSGEDLSGVLAQASYPGGRARVQALHGGGWRRLAFADAAEWPAVATAFERPALRCEHEDGTAVLWRFAGTDAAEVAATWRRPSTAAWRPPLVGTCWGFVGTRWVAGRPLALADLDDDLLGALAAYLEASAGPVLAATELVGAVDRLAAAVEHGIAEVLGADAVAHVADAVAAARELARSGTQLASATDGRTDPHGWVRSADGRVWKVDGFGPAHDHTLVGTQPLTWDVAGVIVSWELPVDRRAALVAQLGRRHRELVEPGWLRFHELGRAVLDLGRFTMSAPPPADGDEARHAAAVRRARSRLASLVGVGQVEGSGS